MPKTITITQEELKTLHRLKSEVYGKSKLVDPDDGHDWFTLVYGFFLGAGLTPKRADKLSLLVVYEGWLEQIPQLPKRKIR